jgi:hypothetical protein
MERYTELLTKRSTQRADTPIRAMSHADMTAQMDIYDGAITAVEEGTGGPISHCPSCGIERYFKHPGPTDTSNPMTMLCSTTPPFEEHSDCEQRNLWLQSQGDNEDEGEGSDDEEMRGYQSESDAEDGHGFEEEEEELEAAEEAGAGI